VPYAIAATRNTLTRVLMVDPPDPGTTMAVRRAATAILADLGVRGAMRQYGRIRRIAGASGTLDDHLRARERCRDQVTAVYPPPRPRPARPRREVRPLIDVLTERA
jgi:hypothetical protein